MWCTSGFRYSAVASASCRRAKLLAATSVRSELHEKILQDAVRGESLCLDAWRRPVAGFYNAVADSAKVVSASTYMLLTTAGRLQLLAS